jgi:hypothetical protein
VKEIQNIKKISKESIINKKSILKINFCFIIISCFIIFSVNQCKNIIFTKSDFSYIIITLIAQIITYSSIFPMIIGFMYMLIHKKFKIKRLFSFYNGKRFFPLFLYYGIIMFPFHLFLFIFYNSSSVYFIDDIIPRYSIITLNNNDIRIPFIIMIATIFISLFPFLFLSISSWIYASNPKEPLFSILKQSILIFTYKVKQLILFELSFAGWIVAPTILYIYIILQYCPFEFYFQNMLLYPMMFGEGFIFIPYYLLCKIQYYNLIIQQKNGN